jgi:hypothetical protein
MLSNSEEDTVSRTSDRRENSRFEVNMRIVFSPFSSRRNVIEHTTRTCNYSPQGACFEFGQPINPGTVLFIRSEQLTEAERETAGLFRTTTLAEVKWCEKIEEPQGAFRVGVSYY